VFGGRSARFSNPLNLWTMLGRENVAPAGTFALTPEREATYSLNFDRLTPDEVRKSDEMQCEECEAFRRRLEQSITDLALTLEALELASDPIEQQIFTLVAEYANSKQREVEQTLERHHASHRQPAMPLRATRVRMVTSGAAF
jgi:hypothetical protein